MLIRFLLFVHLSLILACQTTQKKEEIVADFSIIPTPAKILKRAGYLNLEKEFGVIANVSDSISSNLATYLVTELEKKDGFSAYITDLYSTRKHKQSISLEISGLLENENTQSYQLDLTGPQIKITSSSANGIFYGIQSMLQILDSAFIEPRTTGGIRKMIIKDQPVVTRRGLHLTSKINNNSFDSLLNVMSMYKLNLLLLPDDQNIDKNIQKIASEKYIMLKQIGEEINSGNGYIIKQTSEQLAKVYDTLKLDTSLQYLIVESNITESKNTDLRMLFAAQSGWSGSKK